MRRAVVSTLTLALLACAPSVHAAPWDDDCGSGTDARAAGSAPEIALPLDGACGGALLRDARADVDDVADSYTMDLPAGAVVTLHVDGVIAGDTSAIEFCYWENMSRDPHTCLVSNDGSGTIEARTFAPAHATVAVALYWPVPDPPSRFTYTLRATLVERLVHEQNESGEFGLIPFAHALPGSASTNHGEFTFDRAAVGGEPVTVHWDGTSPGGMIISFSLDREGMQVVAGSCAVRQDEHDYTCPAVPFAQHVRIETQTATPDVTWNATYEYYG